jgi:hypothetical protein
MSLTIQDAVDFVLTYRCNKVFRGMSPERIAAAVTAAIEAGSFGYTRDERGSLTGICVAVASPSEKRLHVKHVLTIVPGAIRQLLEVFHRNFDGWTITAHRRGRFITYTNTPRLVQKLEAI